MLQAHASKEAERLGVVGWVSNSSRDTVEGEVQGKPEKVAAMKVGNQMGELKDDHGHQITLPLFAVTQLPLLARAPAGNINNLPAHLNTLLCVQEWLQTTGSPASRVDKCVITEEKSDLSELGYSEFETRR